MALRATTPPNTADQPALSRTARRRKLRQAKTVLATEAGSPLHQAAAATEIFWTKPSTGTPKPVQEQVVIADDDRDDSAEDNADRMTAGRTWEGLEEDIAYCETEVLTHSASTCDKCHFSRSDVTLAVGWVRQWMADTPSAMNSTLELWSEFLWNVCGFELDLPTAASVLSPAFLAALAEQGVPFAIRRLELVSEGILEDPHTCDDCGFLKTSPGYCSECHKNRVGVYRFSEPYTLTPETPSPASCSTTALAALLEQTSL
ncbi:unnamed protein product [Polarella glacialis]|uniref:Uncharacterized protein n=1 Tax=Polarella glacialis TaxID=89957 RepID=A0A813EFW1_POLGL|nr:unnamed protein product [Polarella glacialis]CAE8609817.1 unnamed protein product [Polarella glacialis]